MKWGIAAAKQRFSELISATTKEPQLIYNRNRLVAAVIEAESFQEFLQWHSQRHNTSLADTFVELRGLCTEEDYVLDIPARLDRPNPFADGLDDVV